MAQTVEECLTTATDSVSLINDVNVNNANSIYIINNLTQDEVNEVVQRNVDHLEIILAYDGTNNTPDVAGSSDDKSSYNDAIETGKAYIEANS